MIDDELDRILEDIDSEKEYAAKKGSKNPEVQFYEQELEVSPQTGYVPDKKDVSLINQYFNAELPQSIHRHIDLAKIIRMRLDITEVPEQIVPIVKKSSHSIFKIIEDITILTDKCVDEVNDGNVRRKASKDLPLYFNDEYSGDNKLDFVVLKRIFVHIRSFNSLIKKSWSDLEKQTAIFNFSEGGKKIASQINDVIVESDKLCKSTDRLLELIASHLGLIPQYYNASDADIRTKMQFNEYKSYKLSQLIASIRDMHRNETPDDSWQETGNDSIEKGAVGSFQETVTNPIEERAIANEEGSSAQTSCDDNNYGVSFTVRGKKSWNTREPYIVPIDQDVLAIEEEELEYMVYFIKDDISKERAMSEIKRAIVKLTIDRTSSDSLEAYGEFIYKRIVSLLNESVQFFQIPEADQWLYYYHLGPYTSWRMLLSDLQLSGQGYCFSVRDGKKVKKILPYEYLKKLTSEWYENNVSCKDMQFDSVNALDLLRRNVSRKYYSEIDEFVAKIDAYIKTLSPEIVKKLDRKSFIKNKALQVYSQKHIIVCNRFIDKTIFK